MDMGESSDQRWAIERLELVELRGIDKTGNHFANVVLLFQVGRHNAVKLADIVFRLDHLGECDVRYPLRIQIGDDPPAKRERVPVVLGQVVGNAGLFRKDSTATE